MLVKAIAPTNPEKITVLSTIETSTIPLPIVAATLTPKQEDCKEIKNSCPENCLEWCKHSGCYNCSNRICSIVHSIVKIEDESECNYQNNNFHQAFLIKIDITTFATDWHLSDVLSRRSKYLFLFN